MVTAAASDEVISLVEYIDGLPTLRLDNDIDKELTDIPEFVESIADHYGSCVSLDLSQVTDLEHIALENLAGGANALVNHSRRIHLREPHQDICKVLDRLMLSDGFCTGECCMCSESDKQCGLACSKMSMDLIALPADFSNGRKARKRVDAIAEQMGYSPEFRADVQVAVGEAFANAVGYGCGNGQFVLVSCLATPQKLCIAISDSGSGFCAESLVDFDDNDLNEHGRGILCIKALMDEVDFDFDAGTTIRMVKNTF